jgi:hypothetical protein
MVAKRLFKYTLSMTLGLYVSAAALAAGNVPLPPSPVCINNQCTANNTPPPPPNPAPGGNGPIKWNPGHYMDSDSVLNGGSPVSSIQGELNDLNNQDAIQGIRINITWGALESSQGNYTFDVIDNILNQLKSSFNKPKHLVIYLWLFGQGAWRADRGNIVPQYIQQNAAYGNSPVSGSYGWWGYTANGTPNGMWAPAIYYGPVMDRLIALVQALGARYDSDPNVEAIEFQEDATIAQAASAPRPADPNYSDANWYAQLQRLLSASTSAFPHTNVIMDNSWFDRPPYAVNLTQWMANNRIVQGTADTWGESGIDQYGTSHLSDGVQALLGVNSYGAQTDLRSRMPRMMAIEGFDIAGNYFARFGGPWTPADICTALNQTYHASHAFWTHLNGTEATRGGAPVPTAAIWKNLAATVSQKPLTYTQYPYSQ